MGLRLLTWQRNQVIRTEGMRCDDKQKGVSRKLLCERRKTCMLFLSSLYTKDFPKHVMKSKLQSGQQNEKYQMLRSESNEIRKFKQIIVHRISSRWSLLHQPSISLSFNILKTRDVYASTNFSSVHSQFSIGVSFLISRRKMRLILTQPTCSR